MKRANGVVLIDANLLMIYLIALYNFDKVENFLPGNTTYFPSDHLILKDIVKKSRKCIVTPNILTEDLELASTLGREGCFVLNINHLRQYAAY